MMFAATAAAEEEAFVEEELEEVELGSAAQ
jgi:hypothetical protein